MSKVKEAPTKKKSSVELIGWRVTESMEHTDGYLYFRIDCCDDGIEWYEDDGNQGMMEHRISNTHPEIAEELEEAYQKSKQSYPYLFSKKKKKK